MLIFQKRSLVGSILSFSLVAVFLLSLLISCAPTTTATPPIAKQKIKIGVIGPMTFELPGKHQWMGAVLASEEINAKGGVKVGNVNYDIDLVQVDDNDLRSVTDAVSAMKRVIEVDKVDFVIGSFRSEAALAMQEVAADRKKIFIGCGPATSELCTRVNTNYERYKYWFRPSPINSEANDFVYLTLLNLAVNSVKDQLGIAKPKVALEIEKAAWADPFIDMCNMLVPKMNAEIVGTWRPSAMATDLTPELTAIKDSGAQVIFEVFSGMAAITNAKQWGELQIPAVMAGDNASHHGKTCWTATSGRCEYEIGQLFIARNVSFTDATIPFYTNYEKRWGMPPLFGSQTYDAVYILKEAITRAGSMDTDTIIKEMEKADYPGAFGRVVFTSPQEKNAHDVKFAPGYVTSVGVQWIKGEQVVVWPDGRAALPGDKTWEGFKYGSTTKVQLPPWVVEYWKNK